MTKTTGKSKNTFTSRKKLWIVLTSLALLLVVIPGTALAYAGFVPVLTPLMRTNKPVDLGVHYSTADFKSLQQKARIDVSNFDTSHGTPQDIASVSPGDQLVIYGANSNQTTLTQQELTAFINLMPWTDNPLSNAQLRLNDGTFEFSGNIKATYVADLIKSADPTGANGNIVFVRWLAGHLYNPAVYLKAKATVTSTAAGPSNGELTLDIVALKVNRMDFSKEVGTMPRVVVKLGEGNWNKGYAYSLSSLTVSSGLVNVYGTIPSGFGVGSGDPTVVCDNLHASSLISLNAAHGSIGSYVKYCD